VVVLEENARFRVDGNVNVGPAVVVKVVGYGCDRIARTGFQNPRSLGDIGKSSVAIVVIEKVVAAWKAPWSAHDRDTLPLAVACLICRRDCIWIQLDVVADEQIEMAVAVIVEKSTT